MKQTTKAVIAASAFGCAALFSFGWSEQGGVSLSVENAQARVGRPWTPVSVAGVARRQHRRSVYGYGVGAGAVAVGTAAAVAAANSPYYNNTGYYGTGYDNDGVYHGWGSPGYYNNGAYGTAPHATGYTTTAPYTGGVVAQPGYASGAPYAARAAYDTGPHYTGWYQGGPYHGYGTWDEYAKRNGIVCQPGTTVKLEDGNTYPCQ
jgi:hypothetical protein